MAAVKVDKEFLLKNRFWIGLGVFVPIWLVTLITVLVVGGSSVADGEKAIKDANDKLGSISNPKTDHFTAPLIKRKEVLQAQKDRVWDKAWQGQRDLMTWPEVREGGSPITRDFYARMTKGGYFGEEIPYQVRSDHHQWYKNQFPLDPNEVASLMYPVEGDWARLMVRANFRIDNVPTTEDIWLAQEDLWVQRELLNIIKAAQDSVGKFENIATFKWQEIDPDEDREREKAAKAAGIAAPPGAPPAPNPDGTVPGATPPGAPAPAAPATPEGGAEDKPKDPDPIHIRYRNPFWQLDMYAQFNAEKKELVLLPKSTLRNVTADRIKLPPGTLTLELTQSLRPGHPDDEPIKFTLTFQSSKEVPWMGWVDLKKPVVLAKFNPQAMTKPHLSVELLRDQSFQPPQGAVVRQRYRSPHWELDLILTRDPKNNNTLSVSDKTTIRNINLSRRALEVGKAEFLVSQEGGFQKFRFDTDSLVYGQTAELKKMVPFPIYNPAKPLEVEQFFHWTTSPIKRVNSMLMYKHSHKTANQPLVQAEQFKPKDDAGGAAAAAPAAAAPGAGPGMGAAGTGSPDSGGAAGAMGIGIGGGMGGMGGATAVPRTANGLVQTRYIYTSQQVRRMPVALALVVDQSYLQDILTAVANSRLRIQITQVHWHHVTGIRPSQGELSVPSGGMAGGVTGGEGPDGEGGAGGKGGEGVAGPGASTLPAGRGGMSLPPGGGRMMPPGAGGMMPPGGGMGGFGTPAGGDDSDPNLIEVAVYGLASMYERFPPRPPKEEAGAAGSGASTGSAGATGTPGATGATKP